MIIAGLLTTAHVLLAQGSTATQQHLTGAIYGGPEKSTILYHWDMNRDDVGGRWTSRYRTPDGALAVKDDVVWSGGQFRRYSYVRYSTSEVSSVELRGTKLIYTRVINGKADQAEEDYVGNFTVGPTVIIYVQRHWAALMSGKSLPIRYGVLDRMESIGFNLRRDTEHPRSTSNTVVIRMQASSLFIRMFVDPVYLVLSMDGSTLYDLIGRMLPVDGSQGHFRPVDGDLRVRPPEPLKPMQP